jgi:dolichol-phosphate mannosyltransferase
MTAPVNPATGPIDVSVVSPVYGCRPCLEELVDDIAAALAPQGLSFEVILVDDASPDEAWARIIELGATRPWLRGLRLSRNFGQHSAISCGIQHVRGDWVVVLDCDLQDPPAAIPALLDRARRDDLDVVFASRVRRKDSFFKRLSSWGFFRVLSWLTGMAQDESTANFGIYRRKVIDAVAAMPERDRSFPLMVRWAGFRTATEPVEHAARRHGETSYTLRKLLRLATNIALGYSEKPLRLVAMSGIACALVAFLMVGYSVLRWLDGSIQVAGYTSIMASVWLVGGMVLFSLGVVGLYVGQVFRNVQGRPYYIVSERVNP